MKRILNDALAAIPVAAAFVVMNIFRISGADLANTLEELFGPTAAIAVLGALGAAVLLIPSFYILTESDGVIPVGISPVSSKPFFVIYALGASALCVMLNQIQSLVLPASGSTSVLETLGGENRLIYYLAFSLLPALCEELLFRKAVLSKLMGTLNCRSAILLSAFYFALLHGSVRSFAVPFIMGLFLGYAAAISGKLWPPVLIHVAVNSYSFVFENYFKSNSSAEGGLFFALFNIALLIVCLYFCLKRFERDHEKFRLASINSESRLFETIKNQRIAGAVFYVMIILYIIMNFLILR